MIRALLLSLALTLVAELALGWLLGLRRGLDMAVVALMNVMTNPPLVFTVNLSRAFLPPDRRWLLLLGFELAAFAAEALVLRLALVQPWKRALTLSAALNLGSYLLGVLISRLL